MYNISSTGEFPFTRMRRNRKSEWSGRLLQEYHLHPDHLILPLFIQEGKDIRTPIASMPGTERLSVDNAIQKVREAASLNIPAIALFPVIEEKLKSEDGKEALSKHNLVCRAIQEIKDTVPEIGIICDVALDPYTTHGHDGIVKNGDVDNDKTVEMLCKQALVLAEAGADMVAPSDMMDGRIKKIRQNLEKEGFYHTQILSYAAKYASAFYGPFREAVGSAGALGKANKKTYQMNPANKEEAIREVALDIEEGADIIMIKPGLPYLDIISHIKQQFAIPVFAYQVSGEYAMIKAAAEKGWLDENEVFYETLLSMRRAGASGIFTYAALEMAKWLQK